MKMRGLQQIGTDKFKAAASAYLERYEKRNYRRMECFAAKTSKAKLIGLLFDTIGMVLFSFPLRWVLAKLGHPTTDWQWFPSYIVGWYAGSIIRYLLGVLWRQNHNPVKTLLDV